MTFLILRCIIFCQPASLDCQNICQSPSSAVWPYYCVIIKWKPGGSIVWIVNLTACSLLVLMFLLLTCLYGFSVLFCFESVLRKTHIDKENMMLFLQDKLEGSVQSSDILSSFLLLLWECWMLHCSVLHPFNAKKQTKGSAFHFLHIGRRRQAEAHLRHCFLFFLLLFFYVYASFGWLI